MKLVQKIGKYICLTKEEKALFRQALYLMIGWKMRIILFPMRKYAKFLGKKGEDSVNSDVSKDYLINKFTQAIHRADSVLPWESKCLTEAIATKRLLERYNIKSTLFLGVTKDENQKLIAHAWLRYGEHIISGERGYLRFTIVEKFT